MVTIANQASRLIEKQLQDYRLGAVKYNYAFARELEHSLKYVEYRIVQRRKQCEKKRKRSVEPDGDRVRAIVGHTVQPDGEVIYEVKWLGWEQTTFEPRANLDGNEVKHCPELLWLYHRSLPNDDDVFLRGAAERQRRPP
ncbi:hypothetical protein LTR17_014214 [Elasticomyces elasticus]|nr:hypothetical protein LTR17_014214 [Elasticomyces elasticus]